MPELLGDVIINEDTEQAELRLDVPDYPAELINLAVPSEVEILHYQLAAELSEFSGKFQLHESVSGRRECFIYLPHNYSLQNLDLTCFDSVFITVQKFENGFATNEPLDPNIWLKLENVSANNLFVITGTIKVIDCNFESLAVKLLGDMGTAPIFRNLQITNKYKTNNEVALYIESNVVNNKLQIDNLALESGDIKTSGFKKVSIINSNGLAGDLAFNAEDKMKFKSKPPSLQKILLSAAECIMRPLSMANGEIEINAGVKIQFLDNEDSFFEAKILRLIISSESPEKLFLGNAQDITGAYFDEVYIDSKGRVYFNWPLEARKILVKNVEYIQFNDVDCGVDFLYQVYEDQRGSINFEGIATFGQKDQTVGTYHTIGKVYSIFKQEFQARFVTIQGGGQFRTEGNVDVGSFNMNEDLAGSLEESFELAFLGPHSNFVKINNLYARLNRLHLAVPHHIETMGLNPLSKVGVGMELDPGVYWESYINIFESSVNLMYNRETGEVYIEPDASRSLGGEKDIHFLAQEGTDIGFLFLHARQSIPVGGAKGKFGNVGVLSEEGNVYYRGDHKITGKKIVSAPQGMICSSSDIHGAIVTHQGKDIFHVNSRYMAEDLTLYAFNNIVVRNSLLHSMSKALMMFAENGTIYAGDSTLKSGCEFCLESGGGTLLIGSTVEAAQMITESLGDFITARTEIKIRSTLGFHESHSEDPEPLGMTTEGEDFLRIMGLGSIAEDLSDYKCSKVRNLPEGIDVIISARNVSLLEGTDIDAKGEMHVKASGDFTMAGSSSHAKLIYIDAKTGVIAGGNLSAEDSVVVKTKEGLFVVPLIIHNELSAMGGYNAHNGKSILTKLEAGLVDLSTDGILKMAGTIVKATNLQLEGDVIDITLPEHVEVQKQRIKEIFKKRKGFLGLFSFFPECHRIVEYFYEDTIVNHGGLDCQLNVENLKAHVKKGKVNPYLEYGARNVSLLQDQGDVILDHSITFKPNLMAISAPQGKVLIASKHLQQVFSSYSNVSQAHKEAMAQRTIIGGNSLYIEGNIVEMQAGCVKLGGNLTVIAKDGVHSLPVSVFKKLSYSEGSKDSNIEEYVKQIVSEINVNQLDVDAGKLFQTVSSIIKVTKANIKAEKLMMECARDIIDREVHFRGAKHWLRKRNESHEEFHDEYVVPPVFEALESNIEILSDAILKGTQFSNAGDHTMKVGGSLKLFKEVNIHVNDGWSKKSSVVSFKGGIRFGSTKTARSHFYNEDPVPTIIYSGGNFFCFSGEKMHMMGSNIIGNNVHIYAPKGLKMEASPYYSDSFNFVKESSFRVGLNFNKGVECEAAFYNKRTSASAANTQYTPSGLIAENELVIDTGDGDFEQISSNIHGGKSQTIKAANWLQDVVTEQITQKTSVSSQTAGFRMGIRENLSAIIETAQKTLQRHGGHYLEYTSQALNAYNTYQKSLAFAAKPIEFYAEFFAKSETMTQEQETRVDMPNEVSGGNLRAIIKEKAVLSNIRCNVAGDFDLQAKEFIAKTGKAEVSSSTASSSLSVNVSVTDVTNIGASANAQSSSRDENHYQQSMMRIGGKLKLRVDEGQVIGVDVVANEVDIIAKNFKVESLQSVIQESMSQVGGGISFSGGQVSGLNPSVGAGEFDSKWTESLGRIIGAKSASIIVEDTLHLVGGLIANAEVDERGNLTDKGELQLKAANLMLEDLQDYDRGNFLALDLQVEFAREKKESAAEAQFKGLGIKAEHRDSERLVRGTLGAGNVDVGSVSGGELNRDVSAHVGETSGDGFKVDTQITAELVQGIKGIFAKSEAQSSNSEDERTVAEKVKSYFRELKLNITKELVMAHGAVTFKSEEEIAEHLMMLELKHHLAELRDLGGDLAFDLEFDYDAENPAAWDEEIREQQTLLAIEAISDHLRQESAGSSDGRILSDRELMALIRREAAEKDIAPSEIIDGLILLGHISQEQGQSVMDVLSGRIQAFSEALVADGAEGVSLSLGAPELGQSSQGDEGQRGGPESSSSLNSHLSIIKKGNNLHWNKDQYLEQNYEFIANVNPEIDAQEADYFLEIHFITGKWTHATTRLIGKDISSQDNSFGKYPRYGYPINPPKIVNDFAHIEQDSVNKMIVPITEEALIKGDAWLAQYESYYVGIGANCVDFVQDFYNILGGPGNFTHLFKHFNSNVLSERYAKQNYGVNKIVTPAVITIEDIAKEYGYSIQNIKDCGKYLDYEDELFVEKRVFKIKRNFKKK